MRSIAFLTVIRGTALIYMFGRIKEFHREFSQTHFENLNNKKLRNLVLEHHHLLSTKSKLAHSLAAIYCEKLERLPECYLMLWCLYNIYPSNKNVIYKAVSFLERNITFPIPHIQIGYSSSSVSNNASGAFYKDLLFSSHVTYLGKATLVCQLINL